MLGDSHWLDNEARVGHFVAVLKFRFRREPMSRFSKIVSHWVTFCGVG